MRELHGIRGDTPKNLLFGPGKGYMNIDMDKLLDPVELDPVNAALVGALAMGATRGGFSFAVEPDMREIELDGKRGPQMGTMRKNFETATITVNFAELTIDNILRMVPGATREDIGNGLTHITGGELGPESYIRNVAFLATHGESGREYPAIIVIENALATEGLELELADQDEGVPEVTFQAHYNTATPDDSPWHVFVAPLDSELPAPTVTDITPISGTAGSTATANGTNMAQVTSVTFDGAATTIQAGRTDTALPFLVPVGKAAGTYPVVLTYPGGTVAAGSFTIPA